MPSYRIVHTGLPWWRRPWQAGPAAETRSAWMWHVRAFTQGGAERKARRAAARLPDGEQA